ncbi:MAG: hypothetical protein WA080_09645 [Sulfuricurvum sp.]
MPLNDIGFFEPFFIILKDLKERGLTQMRMEHPFQDLEILPNTSFGQFLGQMRDRDKKIRLQKFLSDSTKIIQSPLIHDDEIDSLGEKIEPQYHFEAQSTLGGLACADIWGTIAISFRSDRKWDTSSINLQRNGIPIDVKHIATLSHIAAHKDFFDELEQCIQLDIKPSNFWERKDELFKNKIIFCDEVKKQIKNIDTVIFSQAIFILRDIENGIKCLTNFTTSGESATVEQNSNLKKLREFEIDDKKEYFQNHIKNLSNGYRIYYFEKNEKIYIGYIGQHLPTQKF